MKPRKSTVLVVLLTFVLAAFALALAQGTTQTDQKKKADSCCAEGSNCCAEVSDRPGNPRGLPWVRDFAPEARIRSVRPQRGALRAYQRYQG